MNSVRYRFRIVDREDPEFQYNAVYVQHTCKCLCSYGCFDDELLIYEEGHEDCPSISKIAGADKDLILGLLKGDLVSVPTQTPT